MNELGNYSFTSVFNLRDMLREVFQNMVTQKFEGILSSILKND